jgi:hypothetical protein
MPWPVKFIRMAVWKQRLGGARFGSADQAEYWAGYAVSNAMILEIRAGLGGASQRGAGQKTAS